MTRLRLYLGFGLLIGILGWAKSRLFSDHPSTDNMYEQLLTSIALWVGIGMILYFLEPFYKFIKSKITGRKEPLVNKFSDFWD